VLLVLCCTLVHGATWAIPRYRVPVVPWVVALAVVGALFLIKAGPDAPLKSSNDGHGASAQPTARVKNKANDASSTLQ